MNNDAPVPHPRLTARLLGHAGAERQFLDAFEAGRMPHAWLLAGPEGAGKATFAYCAARFLIANGQEDDAQMGGGLFGETLPAAAERFENLYADPDTPGARLLASGSHPNVKAIERAYDEKAKAFKKEISVDSVRALQGFFGLTASDGGWRIAIIDTADHLNRQAANALLKILEEPPKKSILFLLTAAPGRLLPTIRSRCRTLKFKPLEEGDVSTILTSVMPEVSGADAIALARLSGGAPGRAMVLAARDGLKMYERVRDLFSRLPSMPPGELHALADAFGAKAAQEASGDFIEMVRLWLAQIVRAGAGAWAGAGEETSREILSGDGILASTLAQRTNLEALTALWEKIAEDKRRSDGLNLDRRQTLFDLMSNLKKTL